MNYYMLVLDCFSLLFENTESMYFSLHLTKEDKKDQRLFPELLIYLAAEPAL